MTPYQPSLSRKMPIGIQSFEYLRRNDYVYIDKTALIYRLATMGKPYFLSRPRRFGKSLLLSTMEAYFLGKRELFKGLALEQLETEWATHAVLHLDLNAERYDSRERLENMLEYQLEGWEEIYGTSGIATSVSTRFMEVIKAAYKHTGRGVVVLIDEYDKPLLRSFDNRALQDEFREMLTAFYTVLKTADPWLQFVFITGVTKFAQMGIFSTLNQLNDISFDADYATLCGLTLEEIETNLAPELEALAQANNQTHEETITRLKQQYDGYRFSEAIVPGMFNPFSVLSVMAKRTYKNYWFSMDIPTFLSDMLRKTDFDLRKLDGLQVIESSLTCDRPDARNPVPMIYQSGYLTIKEYDPEFQEYTLGFPNDEVRNGFQNFAYQYLKPDPRK